MMPPPLASSVVTSLRAIVVPDRPDLQHSDIVNQFMNAPAAFIIKNEAHPPSAGDAQSAIDEWLIIS